MNRSASQRPGRQKQLPSSPSSGLQKVREISRIVQGILYMLASIFHFINDKELSVIPPALPARREALVVTGVFELLGGAGLLIPRFRRFSAWGLAALLVAIWPANIYHAIIDRRSRRWQKSRLYHIFRIPLQVGLIAWVLWAGSPQAEQEKTR